MNDTIRQLISKRGYLWTFAAIITVAYVIYKRKKKQKKKHNKKAWNYKLLKQMVKENNIQIPAMFVDLDVFEKNVKTLASIAKKNNKTLRMATKSIRCPYLIHHAMKISNGTLKGSFIFYMFYVFLRFNHLKCILLTGFMCFSVFEGIFLSKPNLFAPQLY